MSGPLSGITVIELGHSVAAPYAGLTLASLGADVIKIERPGKGDDARAWGPPFADGSSTMFNCLNRHKQSVEIDLKSSEGLAHVRHLADDADVFLQNLRPGQAEAIGLGPEILRASNPELIYATISAFGDNGPLKDRPVDAGFRGPHERHRRGRTTIGPLGHIDGRYGVGIVGGDWRAGRPPYTQSNR